MTTEIFRRRTPAERARYLEGRVDELIKQSTQMKPEYFAGAVLTLLPSLSVALADFAILLEDVDE